VAADNRTAHPGRPVASYRYRDRPIVCICDPAYNYYRGIARCPAPGLIAFASLQDDAFQVLKGDSDAIDRFTTALQLSDDLGAAEQDNAVPSNDSGWVALLASADNGVGQHDVESMIPDDRLIPVLAAAAYIDARNSGGTDYYLRVLNRQLSELPTLNALWTAAQKALGGDPRQLDYFHGVLERLGGECGPDINPVTGWPTRKPKLGNAPGSVLKCLIIARTGISKLLKPPKSSPGPTLPSYTINAISPPAACSGQDIVITGTGFGQLAEFAESVSFPGVGPVDAKTWTDTRIVVTVPPGARCGELKLTKPGVAGDICGRFIDVAWSGLGMSHFDGSDAQINSFTANGRTASWNSPIRVDPGATITLAWDVCPTSNSSVGLKVWAAGTVLVSLPVVTATGSYALTLPSYTQTTLLECVLTASNLCAPAALIERIYLKVFKIANLTIDGIKVTQGLQFYHAAQHLGDANDRGADNSLTLVEDKPSLRSCLPSQRPRPRVRRGPAS
jgi:hypothetical protein